MSPDGIALFTAVTHRVLTPRNDFLLFSFQDDDDDDDDGGVRLKAA